MSRPFVSAGVPPVEVVATTRAPARAATRAGTKAPAGSLRRFAGWLSAVFADDGMSARFAAERQHDAGLVRRVESRRRP